MNVEAVLIDADEDGWELHLLTDNGWEIFNIHGLVDDLEKQVKEKITPYLDEGGRASARIANAGLLAAQQGSVPKDIND